MRKKNSESIDTHITDMWYISYYYVKTLSIGGSRTRSRGAVVSTAATQMNNENENPFACIGQQVQ